MAARSNVDRQRFSSTRWVDLQEEDETEAQAALLAPLTVKMPPKLPKQAPSLHLILQRFCIRISSKGRCPMLQPCLGPRLSPKESDCGSANPSLPGRQGNVTTSNLSAVRPGMSEPSWVDSSKMNFITEALASNKRATMTSSDAWILRHDRKHRVLVDAGGALTQFSKAYEREMGLTLSRDRFDQSTCKATGQHRDH